MSTTVLAVVPELTLPRHGNPWADDELIVEMLESWPVKNPKTRINAASTVRRFAAWAADHAGTVLADATTAQCREWLAERATVVAPSTCVKNWSDLVAFYRACENHSTDPLAGRRSPMRDVAQPWAPQWTDTHAATDVEYAAVLATFDRQRALGLRNAIAASLQYRSGLRVSEVARVEMGHVDLAARTVWLPDTKSGRPRRPPLGDETLQLLRAYLHPRCRGDAPGPLLVNVGGRRVSAWMTTNAVQNVIKRAAATAGVPVSPHSLRRGWCVGFMSRGGTESACMEIAGWTSNVMIVRYLADFRAEVAQADFDRVNGHGRPALNRTQRALRSI